MKFLQKLQDSDESTKRRWMFIITAIVMVIVIYLWLAYFNNLIVGFAQPQLQELQESSEFTFWQTMKNGTAILYQGSIDKIRDFGEILQTPREYIISPPR